jgi:hypothetical protein
MQEVLRVFALPGLGGCLPLWMKMMGVLVKNGKSKGFVAGGYR